MKGKQKKKNLYLLNERDKEDYHILCTPSHSNIIILKEILFIELNIELYSIICTRPTCPSIFCVPWNKSRKSPLRSSKKKQEWLQRGPRSSTESVRCNSWWTLYVMNWGPAMDIIRAFKIPCLKCYHINFILHHIQYIYHWMINKRNLFENVFLSKDSDTVVVSILSMVVRWWINHSKR